MLRRLHLVLTAVPYVAEIDVRALWPYRADKWKRDGLSALPNGMTMRTIIFRRQSKYPARAGE